MNSTNLDNPPARASSAAPGWSASAGTPWFALLLPGYAQWSWGQRTRGLVLAGTYAASLATALLLWGNISTWIFLTSAVTCQTLGWVDALKQNPFSGFTPTTVLTATGGGLSLATHAPMIGFLTLIAWPGHGTDPAGSSYLVNRLAYKDQVPSPGQWVWLEEVDSEPQHAARVVAVGGQEVEWTGNRWTVDGETVDIESSRVFAGYPQRWKFRVPSNHVLIDPEIQAKPGTISAPLIVVENGRIVGRAWARSTPFWERRLL